MRLGVLTSGGDCPGLNAVIRAVVRTASNEFGDTVVGYEDGWVGLMEDRRRDLYDDAEIDRILLRGGTILGTGRLHPDKFKAGLDQIKSNMADAEVDALIAIGGEGTLKGAKWLSDNGVPVVGVPKTIDNDVNATDYTFGFDTAVSVATDAIDRLHTTAESHNRILIVEVMGRHVGWIALHAGMAGGAHYTVVPEEPFDIAASKWVKNTASSALQKAPSQRRGRWTLKPAAWISLVTRLSTVLVRSLAMRSRRALDMTCERRCWDTSSAAVHRLPMIAFWQLDTACTQPVLPMRASQVCV